MKTILALETSSPVLSVALGHRNGKIDIARASGPLQHSERLLPLVDGLLKRARLSMSEIEAFVVDRGPGSFTGLRIGFSTLKGWLAIQKKPCYGALSLDMIAARVGTRGEASQFFEDSRLGVLVDARREAIYSCFYRHERGEWVPKGRLEVLSCPELVRRLSDDTTLTGDALIRYGQAIRDASPHPLHFLPERFYSPDAVTLVEWFQKKNPRLECLDSPRDFVPLYFRASEAEEEKKKRVAYAR